MRDLEDQIRDLADATFATTEPVSPPLVGARRSTGWLFGAAAAAVVVVLATVAILARSPDDGQLATDDGAIQLTVADPLNVDLDELAERSDRNRLDRLGPFMTLDFDALGSEWETSLMHAITISGAPASPDTNGYWVQTLVETPTGRRLVVNVQGPLARGGTASAFPETNTPTEPITVRGQPGRAAPGWIEWIEQERIAVQVLPAAGSPQSVELRNEMLEFAELIRPVEVPDLRWSAQDSAGTPIGDATARFSGTLDGTTWKIVSSRDGTTSLAINDRLAGSMAERGPGAPALTEDVDLNVAPVSVPGGTLLWGAAPASVESTLLTLANGDTARVTTVDSTTGRSLFAVPIADELDPVSLVFLDNDGSSVATYDLTSLPPYLGGYISTTITVE